MKKYLLFCVSLCLLTNCHRVPDQIEPQVSYAVQDRYLTSLPSPFTPLTEEELSQGWGQEMQIGFGFTKELDLYQAITAFKRAEFLIPKSNESRLMEIQYEIVLCYYIGKKYQEVLYTFDHSRLRYATQSFPALHDLELILYDTYLHQGMEPQAEQMVQALAQNDLKEAQNLVLFAALEKGDLSSVTDLGSESNNVCSLLEEYKSRKKSPATAQGLNALLPGAGYLYLGQGQSAATAFLLNSLFIAASTYFFLDGNVAAGAIFTSFEAGWYFGGIYGAGLEAKAYNERLYESMASPMMAHQKLFPALMLNYAF